MPCGVLNSPGPLPRFVPTSLAMFPSLSVPGYVGRLEELARPRRRCGLSRVHARATHPFTDRFVPAAQNQLDLVIRPELHDFIGAVVDEPDVVLSIDPDRVRPGLRVQALSNLFEERTVWIELEEPRHARLEDRGAIVRAGARIDEDVLLRIQGDAGGFTDVEVLWHLDNILDVERNVRSRLWCRRWRGRSLLLRTHTCRE
jgi:hypothetical protein